MRARLVQGDLERTPFASACFDLVLLNEVLEHVPDDAAALREAFRLLRPGGALIVFAPNRLFPFETHGVHTRGSRTRRLARLAGRALAAAAALAASLPALGAQLLALAARAHAARSSGFAVGGAASRGRPSRTSRDVSLAGCVRSPARCAAAGWLCERVPLLRAFGASQLLVAVKGEVTA